MIHPAGVARLARLGLMEKLLATGAPPLNRGTFVIDGVRLTMEPEVAARFEAPWLCIRRSVLDQMLVDLAEQAGARVYTSSAVRGLVEEDGEVRGVRTAEGAFRAPLVVGADGPHSVVARLVGAREYHVTAPGRLFLWGYFEGADAPSGYATLGRLDDIGFLAMPADSGLYLAGIAVSMSERAAVLADADSSLRQGLARTGEVAEFLVSAMRAGPVRVMDRWHGYFREPTGPGWVLVGDAGHFKDPTPAQGISDALRQGEKLADVIEDGLGGDGLGNRLQEWGSWRDADAWEMYWFATDMGAGGVNPGIVTQMMLGLGDESDGSERFLRMLNHELAPSNLFTAGRALRAVVAGTVAHPSASIPLISETGALIAREIRRRRLRRRPLYATQSEKLPQTAS
jgi:2-polyprenyl-6-methoxyphenol hydroxylase-like FAD-dependent oxidoreductase